MSEINVTPAEALGMGWSIIPTRRNKMPMVESWKEYQSRQATEAEFQAWLNWNPPSWAIVTGKISARFTLDFDGDKGRETFDRLHIPAHRRTPSGGYHSDLVHPGWRVATVSGKNKKELGARWPGLDIRGDGGYAVFAGETDRGRYTWLHDPTPHPLDAMPEDLREFLGLSEKPATPPSPSKEGDRRRACAEKLVRRALHLVPSEGRNASGFWLALQLRDNGYSKEEARPVMLDYRSRCPEVNSKGEPEEYTEREVDATLDQVYGRPARGPWVKQDSEVIELSNLVADVEQESEEEEGEEEQEEDQEEDQHFSLTGQGVFHTHHEKDKDRNLRPVRVRVCSPLEVVAYARDQNSEAWGRLLEWTDTDKKEHSWVLPMKMLVGDGLSFRETLADGGLDVGSHPKY